MGRRGYPPEFRRKVLDLVRPGGRSLRSPRRLGISAQSIDTWRRPDRIDKGLGPGLSSPEKEELAATRRRIGPAGNRASGPGERGPRSGREGRHRPRQDHRTRLQAQDRGGVSGEALVDAIVPRHAARAIEDAGAQRRGRSLDIPVPPLAPGACVAAAVTIPAVGDVHALRAVVPRS